MNQKINQIVEELVKLDPLFDAHRAELEKILVNILALKPEPVIDSDFVRKLRIQLLEQADAHASKGQWFSFRNNFMKKAIFSASAALVVLLVALVGLQKYGTKNSGLGNLSFGSDVRVTRAADGAFGNLATLTVAAGRGGGGGGGGAESGTSAPMAFGMGGGGGGVSSDAKMMPIYEPVTYKYVYKGDELTLDADKLDVLKKIAPSSDELASQLSALGMGLVNLGSFPGSKVQSVSFNQNNGYNLYVDLVGGSISISGFYDFLPAETRIACSQQNNCPNPEPIKESDIPDDAALISIADAFLDEHGISKAAYGSPEVRNDYRLQNQILLKSNSKLAVYWPEYIDVIYPLKIEGEEIYDESGQKMGLSVGVNIRSNKVTSVYNLSTQSYEASSYETEKDSARILKVAQSGGMYGYLGDGTGRVVEIELGTPTVHYVTMWDYQSNTSQQMLVPSLVFPVTKQPTDGSFYRKSVVVPLIKNILDRNYNGVGGGPIKAMDATTVAPSSAN